MACANSAAGSREVAAAGGAELKEEGVREFFENLGCFATTYLTRRGHLEYTDGNWTWTLDPAAAVVPRDHREWVWVPVEELEGEQYADWTEEIKEFFPTDFLRKGGKDPPKQA